MALKSRKKRERDIISSINVVPYIDVMLVLLIIFMITTPMLTQGVKVDLPKASAKSIAPESEKPIILTVTKTGEYFSNIGPNTSTPVSSESLKIQILQKLKHNKRIYPCFESQDELSLKKKSQLTSGKPPIYLNLV